MIASKRNLTTFTNYAIIKNDIDFLSLFKFDDRYGMNQTLKNVINGNAKFFW